MKKIQIQCFFSKVLTFLGRFQKWKVENVQQRTNALSSKLFEGELKFHVRKEPQNGPKLVEKKTSYDSVLTN